MICAREGCRKPGHPGDAFCSRQCACAHHGVVYQAGSSGSTVGNIVRMAAGKPEARTLLQREAAERDRQSRARVDAETRRRAARAARAAALAKARPVPVEPPPRTWRDYLGGAA